MSLADISKRVPARRMSALALTLASMIGASAFILNNAQQGNARTEGDDVRWQLPPPPAHLRAQAAAVEATGTPSLPMPPAAPQDATELNVAALPPDMPATTRAHAITDMTPPQSPTPQAQSAPLAEPMPQPVVRPPAKPQKQAAPKSEKAAATKQAVRPKNETEPKQAKTKAKDTKPPRYAKVQELPPAPAIEPAPVAPSPPPSNRIPILSSVLDGVNAVGNSLSNLVR